MSNLINTKKLYIVDRGDRLEVNLWFEDSRAVDLEITLAIVARDQRWEIASEESGRGDVTYGVSNSGSFLATVRFTYGWEPPTRCVISNKPPDWDEYAAAARLSTRTVAEKFIAECTDRGLWAEWEKESAIDELRKHPTDK